MTKSELDKKYYPQYLTLLSLVQDGLKLDINTELDNNGDFIDKRVSFGYAIFVLERLRVEKVANEVQVVTDKALDDMYQLGKESMLHEQARKAYNEYY